MAKRRNDILCPKPSYEPLDGGLLRYDRGGYSEAPQNVASLVAAGNEGDMLMLEGGLAVWKTPLWTSWDPDGEPTSPSSQNDEFNATSLDAKWTTVNWGSATSTDVNTSVPGCLAIVAGSLGPTLICAMQSLPSGDFSIVVKAEVSSISSTVICGWGIILSDGTTAGAGNQTLVLSFENNQYVKYMSASTYTNFNTGGSLLNHVNYQEGITHIRLRRSGSTYYSGVSCGGKTWSEETIAVGYTPTHMGLFVHNYSITTSTFGFEYFRYSSSATATFGRSVKHF